MKGVGDMNTTTARHLAARVTELIEQVSMFQARYGKDYCMKPGSPDEAWTLHQTIFDQQAAIASLLDADALGTPLRRTPTWWKWQDTMDTGVVMHLAQEASHLVACCAFYEADPEHAAPHAMRATQATLAGMLHPSTLLVALSQREAVQLAS
jgi:hypothetical protein